MLHPRTFNIHCQRLNIHCQRLNHKSWSRGSKFAHECHLLPQLPLHKKRNHDVGLSINFKSNTSEFVIGPVAAKAMKKEHGSGYLFSGLKKDAKKAKFRGNAWTVSLVRIHKVATTQQEPASSPWQVMCRQIRGSVPNVFIGTCTMAWSI